jgi:glyoxylate/hydroxypyruvate reductase
VPSLTASGLPCLGLRFSFAATPSRGSVLYLPPFPHVLNTCQAPQSTVGILGFGKIGQLTLKRLLGFGIGRALYSTSTPGETLPPSKDYFNLLTINPSIPILPATSLSHLASESDFLVLCCALTPSTTHLVDATFLSKMKKTAYVINTSRGPVVDSLALVEAIHEGRLAGAGLDVAAGEPNIGADHPLVKEQRVVLLPHVGSATIETRGEMSRQAGLNCLAGLGVKGGEWVNEVKV